MAYPVADEQQENDVALRAAAHSRWIELRHQRQPRNAERRDWIQALLMGEELRSRPADVRRVDRIAQTLDPAQVERWAMAHGFFEGLDRLRKELDEIVRTEFRRG